MRALLHALASDVAQRPRPRPGEWRTVWQHAQFEAVVVSGCSGSVGDSDEGTAMTTNTICLWFDGDAQMAADFYAATFPDSQVSAVYYAPADYPSGHAGDVLMVDFTVVGIPCMGLNGGPGFPHTQAFSFQILTESQDETDRYWDAVVGNGGEEDACGWCQDRWGIRWQITPRVLIDALGAGGEPARRVFEALRPMLKIDVATIEAAARG